MTNPFAAAIEWLEEAHGFGEPDDTQIEAAIRVLEAAGKVDKEKAIACLDHVIELRGYFIPAQQPIRALLAALPDKEKL